MCRRNGKKMEAPHALNSDYIMVLHKSASKSRNPNPLNPKNPVQEAWLAFVSSTCGQN